VNCEQFRDLWLQHLDGASLTQDALAEHARQCPRCAALHGAGLRLAAGLGQWQRPKLPVGFAARVLTGVQKDQRRQWRLRRVRDFAGALAASLLLTAGVAYFWPRAQPAVEPSIAKSTEPARQETPVTLRDTVNQAGQAVTQLTTRTADTTMEQTRSFGRVGQTTAHA
jgi:hypothetical protein